MMKIDTEQGKGDFSSVIPRIKAEKDNILEEIAEIATEEDALIKEMADVTARLKLVEARRIEAKAKLQHNNQVGKYWMINKTTLISQALDAQKFKMEKVELALKIERESNKDQQDPIAQKQEQNFTIG